tara:strand:+ start:148 stop:1056 length:909 start_codon:yes stop_codon:yes gene_type:complete
MIEILINTSTFNKDNLNISNFKKKIKFRVNNSGKKVKENFLKKNIGNISGIIAGTEKYNEQILKKAKKLKLICRIGVGTDNIDLEYCRKKKIKVLTSKTDISIGVAEQALSLMFAALKKTCYFDNSIKNSSWKKEYTSLLYKKKIGIIGFGRIGKKIYRLTKPFKLTYFYHDKIKSNYPDVKLKSIEEIFRCCDIITIHLPHNKKTNQIINKKIFSRIKSKIILINTSRGQVINEKDLFSFLIKNNQSVACLDVFKKEPYTGRLKKLKNIVLTPHVSGYSFEIRNAMEKEAVTNLIKKFIKR